MRETIVCVKVKSQKESISSGRRTIDVFAIVKLLSCTYGGDHRDLPTKFEQDRNDHIEGLN